MSEVHPESRTILDMQSQRRKVEDTLGDPTIFPIIYLGWLKRYIEQSGLTLPMSAVIGLMQALNDLAPVGRVFVHAGATAPSGTAAADGSLLQRNEYPRLFAAIGDRYGSTNQGNFRLPRLADNRPGFRDLLYVVVTGK